MIHANGKLSRSALAAIPDPFQQPVVASRWLFATGIFLETLLQLSRRHSDPEMVGTLLFVCAYNVAALVGIHCVPRSRLPGSVLLTLDLLFVAAAALFTRGALSPFLGQCYLIIFTGAMLYGLAGGIVTGIASSLLVLFLAWPHPLGLPGPSTDIGKDVRDLVPYFLIAGGFSGYLAQRVRVAFLRAQEQVALDQQRLSEERVLHREMETAHRMQTSALPATPVIFPGVAVAVRWEFAREVGGDFFSYLTEGGRLGLVLGDVSGKGMPAALIATSVAYLLPWLHPLRDPDEALANLNRDLIRRLPSGAFLTLCFAEVDPPGGTVKLWSAGHPPALLWSEREQRVREADAFGSLLGVMPDWNGRPEEWDFEEGDVLVLYSDGLIETRRADGAFFDTTRAAETMCRNAHRSADEIAAALAEAAQDWGPQTDDLTILVCKREPLDNLSP